jgi:3-oxoacyl-[acyl-carrier protein] reductase
VTGAGRVLVRQSQSDSPARACGGGQPHESNAQKTAEAINAVNPDAAKPYAVDVADFEAVQKAGGKILADFGRCDVLVNNAGITRDTLVMRMSSEDWDVVLDTNLKGAFNFSRAVLRAMVKQRKWSYYQYQLSQRTDRPG